MHNSWREDRRRAAADDGQRPDVHREHYQKAEQARSAGRPRGYAKARSSIAHSGGWHGVRLAASSGVRSFFRACPISTRFARPVTRLALPANIAVRSATIPCGSRPQTFLAAKRWSTRSTARSWRPCSVRHGASLQSNRVRRSDPQPAVAPHFATGFSTESAFSPAAQARAADRRDEQHGAGQQQREKVRVVKLEHRCLPVAAGYPTARSRPRPHAPVLPDRSRPTHAWPGRSGQHLTRAPRD